MAKLEGQEKNQNGEMKAYICGGRKFGFGKAHVRRMKIMNVKNLNYDITAFLEDGRVSMLDGYEIKPKELKKKSLWNGFRSLGRLTWFTTHSQTIDA
jgi:hypothetical protein